MMQSVKNKKFSEPLKILCVEDNHHNMLFTTSIIKNYGGDVVEARNGIEAVERSSEQVFDKILMDLTLPQMDGHEAARLIKSNEGPNQYTPIIALTADLTKISRIRCRDLGFAEYLTKPVTSRVLFDALERHYSQ